MTTIAGTYIVLMVFYFQKSTFCLQVSNDRFSCLVTIHTFVNTAICIDGSVIIHDIDLYIDARKPAMA